MNTWKDLSGTCEANKKTFAERIAPYENYKRAIAGEFQVSVSTVERWINGIANPHPRIQKLVLEWCANTKNKLTR